MARVQVAGHLMHEDSWRDLMPFTSDPGAYSPSFVCGLCRVGVFGTH
jgi:hypothetical protein